MKILLINPSLLSSDIHHYKKEVEKNRGVYPPLGLSYIAAVLRQKNHQVQIIDCDAEENYFEKIKNAIRDFQPELIGFYAMTWTYRQAQGLAREIKNIEPKIKIVIGGPQVTTFPEFSVNCPEFDIGVISEGELTAVELAEAIENNKPLEQIKGIVFKKDQKIILNPSRELIENLDSIPFPARDLLPMEKYFDVFTKEKKFTTILASRGCPFNCTFCDRNNRMGNKWRFRSPKNVIEEIKSIQQNYGINEFMFFDDNFTVDKEWVYEFCRTIEKNNLKIIWEIRTRVDLVNKLMLEMLKKAGCYRIRFGFESGDDQILKIVKKGITVEQSRECAKLCKEVGIEMFGYFMLGSPEETPETLEKTIKLSLEIDPDYALFSKTILIPNTEIFDWGVKNKYIQADYWQKYLLGQKENGGPAISTPQLSEQMVDQYISLANKKFYLRPRYLLRRLFSIRSWTQLSRQIQMAKGLLLK